MHGRARYGARLARANLGPPPVVGVRGGRSLVSSELERIFGAEYLGDLEQRSMSDVRSPFAREVSSTRRQLFDRIDALQGEITRRYRTGEASVESLLQ